MKEQRTLTLPGVVLAGVTGLVTGALVVGLSARLAMRAVAILAGAQPEFSIAGTVGIMIVCAVIGLIAGFVYGCIRPFIPLRGIRMGLAFGVVLAALIALPFFLDAEGELDLVSPAAGAALFAPIGLLFGLIVEGVLWKLDNRSAVHWQRSAAQLWLIPIAFFLVLALAGMLSLTEEFARFPPIASEMYRALDMDYQAAHQLHSVLVTAFAVAFCGLCGLAFWLGGGQRAPSLATLALLVLAAGWFRAAPFVSDTMTGLPAVRVLPQLTKGAGVALIALTLIVWPDGRLQSRWMTAVFVGWSILLLAWLATPLRAVITAPTALMLVSAGLLFSLLALALRWRSSPQQRRQITPVLAGYGVAMLWLTGLWTAALLQPKFAIYRAILPETLFAFGPYLLSWLVLPTALFVSLYRSRAATRSRLPADPLRTLDLTDRTELTG